MAILDLSDTFDSKAFVGDTPTTPVEFIAQTGIRFHAVGSKKSRWVFYKPGTEGLVNTGHLQKDGSITIVNPDPVSEIGFINIKYSDDLSLRDNTFSPYFGTDGVGSSARVSLTLIPSDSDFKLNEVSQPFDLKIREAMPDAVYLKDSTPDWVKMEGLLNAHIGMMVEAFGIARPAICGLTVVEMSRVRSGVRCEGVCALEALYESDMLSSDTRVRNGFKQVLDQLFELVMPDQKLINRPLPRVAREHTVR